MNKDNTSGKPNDDTGRSPEAGEPLEAGRSRGQVVGGADEPERDASKTAEADESGRQSATPRSSRP